jgi:hypothetical protein
MTTCLEAGGLEVVADGGERLANRRRKAGGLERAVEAEHPEPNRLHVEGDDGALEVLGELDEPGDGGLIGLLAKQVQEAPDVLDGGLPGGVVTGGGKAHDGACSYNARSCPRWQCADKTGPGAVSPWPGAGARMKMCVVCSSTTFVSLSDAVFLANCTVERA